MLKIPECRARQKRLLGEMESKQWDLFFTGNYRTIYYLTGCLNAADAPAAFFLCGDGASVLVSGTEGEFAVDKAIAFETYSIDRSITTPWHDLVKLLADVLRRFPHSRAAVERAGTLGLLESLLGDGSDATATVLKLRKRKHPDEVDEIRFSLHLCTAAYDAAREVIRPGTTEADVYLAMYAAVTKAAGTAVSFPGDFACGDRAIRGGGPPTMRKLASGELYILDIFPAPALYFADTCRTFAITDATDKQREAWNVVKAALDVGASAARPGVLARDVYKAVKNHLDAFDTTERSFWHHAGHGIGHHGHEAPRLIPGSEDILEIGDVFTLEPGVYGKALGGGIRLENNYVLTEHGPVNLFDYSLELRTRQ